MRYLSYPRKCSTGSARPFAQLFHVLDSMHESVISGVPVTKRDIYYKDVSLLKTQRVVDNLVDDLAATFDLERSQLNVRATSKGLICGSSLMFHLNSGTTLCPNDTDGSLIPVGEDIRTFSLTEEIFWVLVVEKDAIFQHLCRFHLTKHPSLPGRGLLITGKGYPDMATRHLVKTLSDNLPTSVPIMALVDGDAFGIDILSVYKYGSRALQHENHKLAAGRVKWLGLWSSELATLGIDRDALIPISKHDEKKAFEMLRRSTKIPKKWRKELMHMLHNRRKAEIEILYTSRPDASPGSAPHSDLAFNNMTETTAVSDGCFPDLASDNHPPCSTLSMNSASPLTPIFDHQDYELHIILQSIQYDFLQLTHYCFASLTERSVLHDFPSPISIEPCVIDWYSKVLVPGLRIESRSVADGDKLFTLDMRDTTPSRSTLGLGDRTSFCLWIS
ncbi:Spo11/DNA topoisomerase VI subunit A [Armillaria novae-zelandiae]|uniref:DNA topoisomerase (ATP-hydrolyzing) n=1 Tax=Armillaria novae-zelandiae TaxID=153914 RepID=A0AA39PVG9_9AGAR|nr:Spo11/DNA topoisomerase VI subunit A [Armillaria novae-zelandiae]